MRTSIFLICALLEAVTASSRAGDAAFSPDGRTLWAFNREGDSLLRITLGQPGANAVPIPKSIRAEPFPGLLLADESGVQMVAGGKLWRWNPSAPDSKPASLADLPTGFQAYGLSRGSQGSLKGVFFISGHHASAKNPDDADHSLYALKPGAKAFANVFVRRLEAISAAPTFIGSRALFGGSGDVWDGGIEPEEDSTGLFGYAFGYRCAPIALANTDAGNGGSMGVAEIVIAGDTVWAGLRGRHLGALVSLPLVKRDNTDDHPDLNEQWNIQREQLSRAKALKFRPDSDAEETDTFESLGGLCAWNGKDGSWKLAFRTDYDTLWLIEKDSHTPLKLHSERDSTRQE